MEYEMEELLPVVAKLTEKYTGFESTSITYEKAEQLMGAVLYCIEELSYARPSAPAAGKLPAQRAYEMGLEAVIRKVKLALGLYNQLLPSFSSYKNRSLHDTFLKGIPEFFKYYDAKFYPQDTILTLDYPVLAPLSGKSGIDRIYEYLDCICLEQRFLGRFPENHVIGILRKYNKHYEELPENICEIMFLNITGHLLAQKPLPERNFSQADYRQIQNVFRENGREQLKEGLLPTMKTFLAKSSENNPDAAGKLLSFFAFCLDDILIRLDTASKSGSLNNLL